MPRTEDTSHTSLGCMVVLRLQTPWASWESSAWASSFSSSVRTGREKVISPLLAIGSLLVWTQ